MDILTHQVGRLIFGIPFVLFGLMHFVAGADMAGMVPGWVPGGVFWVYVTGVGLLAGGLGVATGKFGFEGGLILAVLMFTFALTVHLPGLIENGQASVPSLLKDTMLGGAALTYAGLLRKGGKTGSASTKTEEPAG